MTDLRKLARNKDCTVRVPEVCRGDCETTVLAHVRRIGISGGGLKAPDLLGAWCCYPCHMAIDGQTPSQFTREELHLMHFQGVMRTQNKLIELGVVKW